MGKLFKKLFSLTVISLLGYLAFWLYTKIKAAINLERDLPQYLKEIYNEETDVDIKIAFRNYSVSVWISTELLEKSDLIRKTVLDYIDDFYPELCCDNLTILVKNKEDRS